MRIFISIFVAYKLELIFCFLILYICYAKVRGANIRPRQYKKEILFADTAFFATDFNNQS